MPTPSAALRHLLLAAQVLDEVDLQITDDGVELADGAPIAVRWSSLLAAAGDAPLDSVLARQRVCRWLALRRQLAQLPADVLDEQIRAVGLPTGHVLDPGHGWAQYTVLGEALVVGLGVLGLAGARPDEAIIVPLSLWRAAELDRGALWARAAAHLERMGELAATRWRRDRGMLRPMGGCDVVTLLAARSLRAALASSADGLCPVAVPMRTRGWIALSRLDPAFAPAAAAATPPADRGFPRTVLVTADEVVLAANGPNLSLGAADGLRDRTDTPVGAWGPAR